MGNPHSKRHRRRWAAAVKAVVRRAFQRFRHANGELVHTEDVPGGSLTVVRRNPTPGNTTWFSMAMTRPDMEKRRG